MNAEAQRQRQLVALLLAERADTATLATRESASRALRGLQAYRANADASAARALGTAFPTVQALVGVEDFAHLAHEFWRFDPPTRGDLGDWGDAFASWLAEHAGLSQWPYLGDCARLDWAMHCCERAADATLDADSIARLGDTDPAQLRLRLAPGLAVLSSRYPIAMILDAHRSGDDAAFDAVRDALNAERGEAVLVSRDGWRAVATPIDTATLEWTRRVQGGVDLASAMQHADSHFDFTAWLASALSSGWLKGIDVVRD